jgi:hypothetical protein
VTPVALSSIVWPSIALPSALAAPVLGASTPSSVVISNVGYLVGLVVLVVIVVSIVVLRHRRPTSTEANMDSFHRGLAALAPENPSGRRRSSPPQARSDPVSARPRVRGVPARADGSAPREPSTGSEPG